MTIIIQNFESLEKEILNKFRKFEIGQNDSDIITKVSFNSKDLWFVEENSCFVDSREREISIWYKIPDVGKPKDNEIPSVPKNLKIIASIEVRYGHPIREIIQGNENFQWKIIAYSGTRKTFDAEANSLIALIRIINDKIVKEFESINNFILERDNAISLRNRIIESMFSYEE